MCYSAIRPYVYQLCITRVELETNNHDALKAVVAIDAPAHVKYIAIPSRVFLCACAVRKRLSG